MTAEGPLRALGVDGMKGGWVGILIEPGKRALGLSAPTIADLTEQAAPLNVVAIDIPIGLGVSRQRDADGAARQVLGKRKSSLFTTPVREALSAPTYPEACKVNLRITDKSITRQAYELRHKISEVDAWVRHTDLDVREVHPEVSFTALMGQPASHSKSTWAGMQERLDALAAAGIDLQHLQTEVGKAGVDDVIDAAAAAWSATRVAQGSAVSFPSPPEQIEGWARPVAIWA